MPAPPGLRQISVAAIATRTTTTQTPANAPIKGNTCFIWAYNQAATALGATSATDTAGNTWTLLAASVPGTGRYGELWVATNVATVAGYQWTFNNPTSATIGVTFIEPLGTLLGASAVDGTAVVTGFAASVGPILNNVNVLTATDLVITGSHANTNTTAQITTSTAGYTSPASVLGDPRDTNGNIAIANPGATGNTSAGWSYSSSQGSVVFSVALKRGAAIGSAAILLPPAPN